MFRYRDYEIAVRSRLDTAVENLGEDNDYYSSSQDFVPAFNLACQHVAKTLSYLLEQSKIPAEALADLRSYRTFTSTIYSTIEISNALFIEAVHPLPEVKGMPNIKESKSVEVTDRVEVISYKYAASLLSAERASLVHHNPFAPGYTKQGCVKDLAESGKFLTFSYTSPYTNKGKLEIRIFPNIGESLCTVLCINDIPMYNSEIISMDEFNTEIPLPVSMLDFVVEKALYYMSYKQGDGPTVGELSENELNRIISILV